MKELALRSDIVIVGGGAGGLELACKLGRKLGPSKVTLVDSRLYHIWKPSLHEVAAGTLDIHQEGLSYQMLAHDNGFNFVFGPMTALDAATKTMTVGAIVAASDNDEVLPERRLAYGSLVLAIGSTSNYFGVPGARENTISLNATEDAERFRLRMLRLMLAAEQDQEEQDGNGHGQGGGLDVVIIGGGATGVELAAELREASGAYVTYGFDQLDVRRDVRITILEGAARVLAPLPEKVSDAATKLLEKRGIRVVANCRVTAIEKDRVIDKDGKVYPSKLCVWAAGIRAPELLETFGLPLAKGGQVDVDAQLRVKGMPDLYALGDCAACTDGNGNVVPPRAQAAHQQADYLVATFLRQSKGEAPQSKPYEYRDYGSLVSVGRSTSVGSLMGSLRGASWFVQGWMARLMYTSLHLMHHRAVLGTLRTGVLALARFLVRRATPLVKLH
ncbi:NAD(P)/FAD-dependent oxidoreductase [Telluria aromaticivorans]|uniref:NAD(P)/FAD-dependent oxidoreductase n=1 Tax=Telluria aromaticivorans TaxID=2725995 RepID=A0A7Y2JYD4_9BURK|nr:NAD(P)/FAD-dependent oxidoreductase [Telluria aromaticivorans]NNG23295.1 NAD(P)/FAD-dependent oxidoreductase [Telluria aromaticivorans]